MSRTLTLLVWLDRLVNVLIGGSFAETLSARAHRSDAKDHPYWGWTAAVINKLFFWQADHCKAQWEYEQAHPYQGGHPSEKLIRIAAVAMLIVFVFKD